MGVECCDVLYKVARCSVLWCAVVCGRVLDREKNSESNGVVTKTTRENRGHKRYQAKIARPGRGVHDKRI